MTSNELKERPILFNGDMVRAILQGRKMQTRRIVKYCAELGEPHNWCADAESDTFKSMAGDYRHYCPYGVPGDQLWVREKWCHFPENASDGMGENIYYAADTHNRSHSATRIMERNGVKWKPSIFMPRWASRITLEITDVRVERLQEISEADAYCEGVVLPDPELETYYTGFKRLWTSINGADSWDANPWVWVVGFKRVEVRECE